MNKYTQLCLFNTNNKSQPPVQSYKAFCTCRIAKYRIPGNFRGAKFLRISRFLLSREIKFREIPPTGRGHVGLIGHSRKFISQKICFSKI